MDAKPGKTSNPTIFIIISIWFILTSQFMESINLPIGALLRGIFLALAVFSLTAAQVVYLTAKK